MYCGMFKRFLLDYKHTINGLIYWKFRPVRISVIYTELPFEFWL